MYSYGSKIKLSIYGESHAECVGCVLEGLEAGFAPDCNALAEFMLRRAPGGAFVSRRSEADEPVFISGITNGVTDGSPVKIEIANNDVRASDYNGLADIPRPSHADYTAYIKHGTIPTGGGEFSGRMTAPLCAAGALLIQLLNKRGISIYGRLYSVGSITDSPADYTNPDTVLWSSARKKSIPVLDGVQGEAMASLIASVADSGDSVGGVAECIITGLPAGIGDALFDGLESAIASAVFAIPGVKGIEFGSGFSGSAKHGSQNNDAFCFDSQGKIRTLKNDHGGILGGISSGMPVVFRVAFKPTPSISTQQESVNIKTGEAVRISTKGRHDACIAVRGVPCVEAAAALALVNML